MHTLTLRLINNQQNWGPPYHSVLQIWWIDNISVYYLISLPGAMVRITASILLGGRPWPAGEVSPFLMCVVLGSRKVHIDDKWCSAIYIAQTFGYSLSTSQQWRNTVQPATNYASTHQASTYCRVCFQCSWQCCRICSLGGSSSATK